MELMRGIVMRITEVDSCGCLLDAGGRCIVTSGFVSVAVEEQIESGEEFLIKNADGDLCFNQRSPDILKGYNVNIELCQVDPELIGLLTDVTLEEADTDTVGFRPELGKIDRHFALEVWTRVGGTACADEGELFGYLLIPHLTGGVLKGMTVENGPVSFSVEGAYTVATDCWGVGPHPVIEVLGEPAPLEDPLETTQPWLLRTTPVEPPAVAAITDCVYPTPL